MKTLNHNNKSISTLSFSTLQTAQITKQSLSSIKGGNGSNPQHIIGTEDVVDG